MPLRLSSPAPPWGVARPERLLESLGLEPFHQAFPWYGPALQTVRDTLFPPPPGPLGVETLLVDLPDGGQLLALLNRPTAPGGARALVLLVHGLGGDGESPALVRLTRLLLASRFAVLRLNLRGAGAGRGLAPGCYSAFCVSDLLPVLPLARRLTRLWADRSGSPRPLFGVGHSLGGTILLNLCLAVAADDRCSTPAASPTPGRERAAAATDQPLDGLVCLSSPLDLEACSRRLGTARNALSHAWLLRRLIRQVLADPQPLPAAELAALQGPAAVRSLRQFDHRITARRWGFDSVEAYYRSASPLTQLLEGAELPPALLLQSRDDPWIPSEAIETLQRRNPAAGPSLLLTARGGHGGFHGAGSVLGRQQGSWAEQLAVRWLLAQSRTDRAGG